MICPEEKLSRAILRSDGGSRGNPGPAGAGFVLIDPSGVTIHEGGRFLGDATNNVAEYEALLWGIQVALNAGVDDITIECDSELIVRQLSGRYRVKNPGLKPLFEQTRALLGSFRSFRVDHIPRARNTEADALANAAMDAKGMVGNAPYPVVSDQPQTLF